MAICYRHTYCSLRIQINIHDQFPHDGIWSDLVYYGADNCWCVLRHRKCDIKLLRYNIWCYNIDQEISKNYTKLHHLNHNIFLIRLRCCGCRRWTTWNLTSNHMLIFTVDIVLVQFTLPFLSKCSPHYWRKTFISSAQISLPPDVAGDTGPIFT